MHLSVNTIWFPLRLLYMHLVGQIVVHWPGSLCHNSSMCTVSYRWVSVWKAFTGRHGCVHSHWNGPNNNVLQQLSQQRLKSPLVIENECYRAILQHSPLTNVSLLHALFLAFAPVGVWFISKIWRDVWLWLCSFWPLSISSKTQCCGIVSI